MPTEGIHDACIARVWSYTYDPFQLAASRDSGHRNSLRRSSRKTERIPEMSTAEAVAAILSATVPLLVALASLMWWAYRRGLAAGEEKRSLAEATAKIEALQRSQAEILAELASLQQKRRRASRPPDERALHGARNSE
jgi:hypothetical protein